MLSSQKAYGPNILPPRLLAAIPHSAYSHRSHIHTVHITWRYRHFTFMMLIVSIQSLAENHFFSVTIHSIHINGTEVERPLSMQSTQLLGAMVSDDLKRDLKVNSVCSKEDDRIHYLTHLSRSGLARGVGRVPYQCYQEFMRICMSCLVH